MTALTDSAPAITLTASTPDMAPASPVVASAFARPVAAMAAIHEAPTATSTSAAPPPPHPRTRELAAAQKGLKRPPSLTELTHAMRLNPERWSQLKAETDLARAADAAASVSPVASPATASAASSTQSAGDAALSADAVSASPVGADGNLLTSGTPRLRLQVSSLQRTSGSRTSSPVTGPVNTNSSFPSTASSAGSSPVGAPASLPVSSTDDNDATTMTLPLRSGRLPSLAAIQERMARAKSTESNATSGLTSSAAASASAVAPVAKSNPTWMPSTSKSTGVVEARENAKAAGPKVVPEQQNVKEPRTDEGHHQPPSQDVAGEGLTPQNSTTALETSKPHAPIPPTSVQPSIHPLQHQWTLYFDSKATAASARRAASHTGVPNGANLSAEDAIITPPPPVTPLGAGGQAYQAALQKVGDFKFVEDFCRYFNWTKKPSQLDMQSSIQLFKAGIRPMWEDPANEKGGKWTLTMKSQNLQYLDQLWTYLVLGLVGEEVDLHDDVCGAVVATRPRGNRIQVWIRDKALVERVNGLGKRLIKLLDIKEDSGVAVDFTPHSGPANVGTSKFVSIVGHAPAMPRPAGPVHSQSSGALPSSMRTTMGAGQPVQTGMQAPFPFPAHAQRTGPQPNGHAPPPDPMFWRGPNADHGTTQGMQPNGSGSLRRPTDGASGAPPQRPPMVIHHTHHLGMTAPPGMKAIIVPGPPPGGPHGSKWRPVNVGMGPGGLGQPPHPHPPSSSSSNGSSNGGAGHVSQGGAPPNGLRRAASFASGIPGVTLVPMGGHGMTLGGPMSVGNHPIRNMTSPQSRPAALPTVPASTPQSIGLGIGGT